MIDISCWYFDTAHLRVQTGSSGTSVARDANDDNITSCRDRISFYVPFFPSPFSSSSPQRKFTSRLLVYFFARRNTRRTSLRGQRERERKPSRYQLYFSTNLFWTVLGQSRARRWSLELNSHHAEYSLRVDQRSKATKFFLSLLSFFHFDARIFRISTCFTAMAVHQEYESLLERGANVLSILSSRCPTSMENYFSGRESSCDLVAPLRLKSTRAPRFLERIGQRRREASRSRCESSLQPRNISAENKNVCFFLPPLIFLFVFQLNRQLVPTILDEIDRNSGYFYQDGSLWKI